MNRKIVFHNYYTSLNKNNFMFEHDDAPGIGEGILKPIRVIKEKAMEISIIAGTRDFFKLNDDICAYYFLDLPSRLDPVFIEGIKKKCPLYLILMESPIIRPDNYKKENHGPFKKIFTWDSYLVDGQKYFKICIPQNPSPKIVLTKNDRKLITLIASKKKSTLEGELYSKRIEAIEFFEKNYPHDFDLYGNSWDKDVYADKFKFLNLLNRLPFKIPFNFQEKYSTYKGRIDSKIEVLSKYKFSICFENFSNARGYITEKIFDSFYAGCVPIYWGAPDISDYIPSKCYIDMRQFSSYHKLYDYLINITDDEFTNYQNAINTFLASDQYKVFLPGYFSDVLLRDFK